MALLLRFTGALLLLNSASAATDAPQREAPLTGVANAKARLEALVRDMAAGQHGAAAPAPQRINEDVVILEGEERRGEERRRLGPCRCDVYRNGASSGTPICNKVESGQHVCYPQTEDGSCSDAAATRCGGSGATPAASPAPTFFDSDETEAEAVYLNFNLTLSISSAMQLPSSAQFVQALAKLTGTSSSSINVNATPGVPLAVRAGSAVEQHSALAAATSGASAAGTTFTLRATFNVDSHRQREALEAQLQLSEELAVSHHRFRIVQFQVQADSRHPLVCATQAEGIKAEATVLLRQLAALKQTEVDLMRRGVTQSFGAPIVDESLLQRMARTLNVQLPPIVR